MRHSPSQYLGRQAATKLFTNRIAGITNQKFAYGVFLPILQRNIAAFTVVLPENTMAAATRSIRRHFANAVSAVRSFSIELYAAHGGWAPSVRG